MKVARHKISQAIADQSLKSGVTKSFSQEVAAYLLSEHRTNELESIMRDVQADWATAGMVEVMAYSAHPLTSGIKAEITAQVKALYPMAKKIIVTEVRDAAVIGGVRLQIADQQLDMSVEAKLNKFKQLTGKD